MGKIIRLLQKIGNFLLRLLNGLRELFFELLRGLLGALSGILLHLAKVHITQRIAVIRQRLCRCLHHILHTLCGLNAHLAHLVHQHTILIVELLQFLNLSLVRQNRILQCIHLNSLRLLIGADHVICRCLADAGSLRDLSLQILDGMLLFLYFLHKLIAHDTTPSELE
ncbi:unknown [Firmicutes bacterium CAG:791]|nr:unknown [Firmicutes bacterium CAG:791]